MGCLAARAHDGGAAPSLPPPPPRPAGPTRPRLRLPRPFHLPLAALGAHRRPARRLPPPSREPENPERTGPARRRMLSGAQVQLASRKLQRCTGGGGGTSGQQSPGHDLGPLPSPARPRPRPSSAPPGTARVPRPGLRRAGAAAGASLRTPSPSRRLHRGARPGREHSPGGRAGGRAAEGSRGRRRRAREGRGPGPGRWCGMPPPPPPGCLGSRRRVPVSGAWPGAGLAPQPPLRG